MLGRVMRRYQDKLGYVITFEDIYNQYILPIIQKREKIPALSTDYLANDDTKEYCLQEKGCVVVDFDIRETAEAMKCDLEGNGDMVMDFDSEEPPKYSVDFFGASPSNRTRKRPLPDETEYNKRPR
jgi:hypothetical protein